MMSSSDIIVTWLSIVQIMNKAKHLFVIIKFEKISADDRIDSIDERLFTDQTTCVSFEICTRRHLSSTTISNLNTCRLRMSILCMAMRTSRFRTMTMPMNRSCAMIRTHAIIIRWNDIYLSFAHMTEVENNTRQDSSLIDKSQSQIEARQDVE
jgi:hypothetical protein